MKKQVLKYLDDNYNSFSKSFKKIAEYIKYNQSIISFISINELAKETETSPATITRFSKSLGFKGYPDFQKIFQKEVEQQTSYMKGLKNSITEINSSNNILQDMIKTNIDLLQEMDVLEIEKSLDQAVKWIKDSRKLYILGARGSYALAYYLYFMLKEFREGVELMISGASDFTDKLLYTQKNDLLFTISFHPYTNFTYQVTEFFKEHGNKVITVTDKKDSTLGNISDLVLTTKNGEKAYTFVPGTVIINALLMKLGIEDRENVVDKLDKLKEITDRFNIYIDK
ncbi:MurR/RpiR family transcriptional regulator [Fusobacterium sp.]|uniref:MurR/RpiR family transcriptional regulator n=1 Tax=Fusobacterium sp. TaxID=68766 RepID=UPI0025C474EE|nr:MurR/RpiR family transcriptional regulator [Fusobacterium sp.]